MSTSRRRWVALAVGLLALGALLYLPLPWPDALLATRIVSEVDIAAPPERVFAYVSAPVNWPRWHPQSRAVSGTIERTPQPGEQTIEEFGSPGARAARPGRASPSIRHAAGNLRDSAKAAAARISSTR